MNFKICVLICAALISVNAFAARGDLDLSVNGKNFTIESECITDVGYTREGDAGGESLSFSFNDECGKRLKAITKENMGSLMRITYSGNLLFSGPIFTIISTGFRFSTEHASSVVLGKILSDYGVTHE